MSGNNRIIIIFIWNCLWDCCGVEQICSEGMSVVHVINLVATVWDSILLIVVTPTCDAMRALAGCCGVNVTGYIFRDGWLLLLMLPFGSYLAEQIESKIWNYAKSAFSPGAIRDFLFKCEVEENPSEELAASDMHIANDIEKGRKELA